MISTDEKLPGLSAHYKCPMVVSEQIKLANFSHHNFNLCPAGVGSRPCQQKSYFWFLLSFGIQAFIRTFYSPLCDFVACVLRKV